ncbi:lachesin-like isoform X1 [Vespula maculifrons]|uniref:Ig-like domain-containing protein n=2 Tax=Vespula TaxID=7451 RepID=A0A834N342_VESVU|nr:hypothetical protein HZH66_008154 [Vespula vulgaris]
MKDECRRYKDGESLIRFPKEARARINGTSDIYVKTGSLLTLTCLMSQGPHHLGTVAWYRGNHAVVTSPRLENDVNAEPRITVETEWSDALTSRLRITHAKLSDSGNYSCVPTFAKKASVTVHVINEKYDARSSAPLEKWKTRRTRPKDKG